jgi:hypothetical protein
VWCHIKEDIAVKVYLYGMPVEHGMLISRMVTYESNCNVGCDKKMKKIQDIYITRQTVKLQSKVHSPPLDVPGADTSLTTPAGMSAVSKIEADGVASFSLEIFWSLLQSSVMFCCLVFDCQHVLNLSSCSDQYFLSA